METLVRGAIGSDTIQSVIWTIAKGVMGGVFVALAQILFIYPRLPKSYMWLIANFFAFGVPTALVSSVMLLSNWNRRGERYDSTGQIALLIIVALIVFAATTGATLLWMLGKEGEMNDSTSNYEATITPVPRWGLLTGACVLIGLTVFTGAYSVATINNPPRINISEATYTQALSKWRAQNIQEYEITIETIALGGGTRTLRVSNNGNTTLLLDPLSNRTPSPTQLDYSKSESVEGMFAQIKRILDSGDVIHSAAIESNGGFRMAYRVTFDPQLGYPNHMEGYPVTDPGTTVFDANWELNVTELKIISQKTPTVP